MNRNNKKNKILIVDDNPMNLLLTSKILESFGYVVAVSESGKNALEMLNEFYPSLILLDISMPDMDGYEVCSRLKSDQKWKEIPVIFLTANTQTEDLLKGFELGGVDYITKPFKSEELKVRVKTHLELFEAKKEIFQMNQSRDKLYSIIAHDIRSPLSAILQTIDAIDQGYFDPTSEDFKEILHHLRERTKETSTLLTSLLQWTRLQDDNISINLKSSNISVILNSCLDLLRANAEEKNIKLTIETNNELALCDEVSMHTVLRNLISNAIKFTHEGGEVRLKSWKNNDKVCVSVSDTGIGMKPEVIDQIFRKNEHFTSSGTHNEQGTGLGLMLVKDFIKKNNSTLQVNSELEKGTTFSIEIPSA